MTADIKESDWKILRQVHVEALERFCRQVLLEVERINAGPAEGFHRKYLDIFAFMRERDKDMADNFDDLRRSKAFDRIAAMKSHGLLTGDEFQSFSQETRDEVDLILGKHGRSANLFSKSLP